MLQERRTEPGNTLTSPTLWGLSPVQLHDRFWAARGVQVLRPGDSFDVGGKAELYLLADDRSLAVFRLRKLMEVLSWARPDLVWVRVHDSRDRGYREMVVTDEQGRFVRFRRVYGGADFRLARVALTPQRHIARLWAAAPDARTGWHILRRMVSRADRVTVTVAGNVYDRQDDQQIMELVRHLMQIWKRPDATIGRAQRAFDSIWRDRDTLVDPRARFLGPVWIGAGRHVDSRVTVVGPAVLWDEPRLRPPAGQIPRNRIRPEAPVIFQRQRRWLAAGRWKGSGKRAFDIVFSLAALTMTLPLFPVVMLAIYLEDGRPFFFAHRRETIGGRMFPCFKFRSMRKDAEKIKAQLVAKNRSDGPQFFMEDDPRLTRVGRIIRKLNIDELPQFVNVLLGHMSVVGPRPSPFEENQYCPAWREARLSVRPGITGLWQVCRSREPGLDFQEWIRYDIEYAERAGWRLDLWIIWRTLWVMAKPLLGRWRKKPRPLVRPQGPPGAGS